jgi:hypothetical protein
MDYENSMTIGPGPYDGKEDLDYTIKDVAERFEITKKEAEQKKGHIEGRVGNYFISFDYMYNSEDEAFNVLNLHCKEGHYEIAGVEIDYLRDELEDKLYTARYKQENESIFETLSNILRP